MFTVVHNMYVFQCHNATAANKRVDSVLHTPEQKAVVWHTKTKRYKHTRAKQEKRHKRIKYINLPFSSANSHSFVVEFTFSKFITFFHLNVVHFIEFVTKSWLKIERENRTHTSRQKWQSAMLSFLCHCRLTCRLGILYFFLISNKQTKFLVVNFCWEPHRMAVHLYL